MEQSRKQGGGHSFTGNIGYDDCQPMGFEFDHVVIISADRIRGPHATKDVKSILSKRSLRYQAELDLAGDFQVTLESEFVAKLEEQDEKKESERNQKQ